MKTFWKKALIVGLMAIMLFATSIWVVAYLVKNNKSFRASLFEESTPFKQSVRLANYIPEVTETVDFTLAAEQAIHAVVHIRAVQMVQASRRGNNNPDLFEYFFGTPQQAPRAPQPRSGVGSGVIISTDGYIITNNHVVERADTIEVTLNDNRIYNAKIIGTDPDTDIALLKIEATDLQTLPFGDSEVLKVGEWVLAVGNPFNLKSTVTAGIVSAKGRGFISGGRTTRETIESYIQTDAAVNPGNSGGALVNTYGELIGINTALYSETGSFAGYSFAVPISIAGKVVADLKEFGVVQRAVLGIRGNNPQEAKRGNDKIKVLEGAHISEFVDNSSSKSAGLEVGDVITAVNGVSIKSFNELQAQISKFRPGDKVKVDVDRYGTAKNYTVELRNAQGNTDVVAKVDSNDSANLLGVEFQEIADARKRELRINYGIEVSNVNRGGKMQDAGIRRGFIIMTVNNQRVTTIDDMNKIIDPIVKGTSDDKGLFIRGFYANDRNQRTQHYAIDLVD